MSIAQEVRCRADLDTPALCVDLEAMEANIAAVVRACAAHGVAWRPHAKCHKSVAIAHKLLAAGAIGMTCAKLGEAEVMAAGGVTDLLIANLVVGPRKLRRLAQLRRVADPIVCVDHPRQVEALSGTMCQQPEPLRVLVEVDIGLQRVGVLPGAPAVELARRVHGSPGLQLAGIMGYEGHLLQIQDPDEKQSRVAAALDLLVTTAEQLRAEHLPCPIVSCGGTGSFRYAVAHPGITEVQAGGAIFMDEFYRTRCQVTDLQYALTVLTTVVSRPAADRAIIDAGRKTLNMELVMPRVRDRQGIEIVSLSAEHGTLRLAPEAQDLQIGDRLELIPGYGDLTTVLHDRFYALRGDTIEAVWPLDARGRLQ
ncbi:MAG: DSD1 family PLP-dependent enzyme [Pirellulaceae bacterium]|nr:DSD1 family PLP-dependent enzyme [Pirellulaceae bacterium]